MLEGVDKPLTKSDIDLLMETYQNMFLMHKTVLDQQTSIHDCLKRVLDNQKGITENYQELIKIVEKIEACRDILEKSDTSIINTVDTINNGVKNHNDEFLKFIGSINNKVYIAWIGSATIILGLLALFFK